MSEDELYVYEGRERRRLIEAETTRSAVLKAEVKARAEGKEEGKEEGREEVLQIAAKALAKNGFSVEAIASELKITPAEVQKLLSG